MVKCPDRSHSDSWTCCKQSKGWRRLRPLQPLPLRSEISLFCCTSCAWVFFFLQCRWWSFKKRLSVSVGRWYMRRTGEKAVECWKNCGRCRFAGGTCRRYEKFSKNITSSTCPTPSKKGSEVKILGGGLASTRCWAKKIWVRGLRTLLPPPPNPWKNNNFEVHHPSLPPTNRNWKYCI